MRSSIALAALSLLLLVGCNSDVEDTEGDVTIAVTDFNGLPVRFNVNSNPSLLQVDSLTIQSFAKRPGATLGDLQNVRLEVYEVVYRRVDQGTRTPTRLVRNSSDFIPAGGQTTLLNLPLMAAEQLENEPLSDLLFTNGAFDPETNSQVISLELSLQFFGSTVSGDDLATDPFVFTVEFVP